jgi:hypothetical protein
VLAAGQVLAGRPIVGAWLSLAAACAAFCWMAYGWLSPRRAVLIGLLVAVHPVLATAWGQTYWGGAVPMLGGCLVFGALPRLTSTSRARYAWILGLGMLILAHSRPFEGLIACLPVSLAILYWLARRRRWRDIGLWRRVVVPLAAMSVLILGTVGYYNARVTGRCTVMPYQIHEARYGAASLFVWQAPKPVPEYTQAALRAYHVDWSRQYHLRQRTLPGFIGFWLRKIQTLWSFYLGVPLTVAMLALPLARKGPGTRFALVTCIWLGLALSSATFLHAHYFAPAACLVFYLAAVGMGGLRSLGGRRRAWGRAAWVAVVASYLLSTALTLAGYDGSRAAKGEWELGRARQRLLVDLERRGGRHLVLVPDAPQPGVHFNWVQNAADIDSAPVVWARLLDRSSNERLLAYFDDRQVWLLETSSRPPGLRPVRRMD